jgi:hypothetical protein
MGEFMRCANELLTFTDYFYAASDVERQRILKHLEQQSFDKVPMLLGIRPHPAECIESILFRSAANNGLIGISQLCRALGLPERHILNPERIVQLTTSLQIDKEALADALPTIVPARGMRDRVDFGRHRLRREQLALSTTRLCPQCVAEQGYGHSYWALAPFTICDVHRAPLIDQCPTCKREIALSRPGYALCQCGANLARHTSAPATAPGTSICTLLAARFKRTTFALDVKEHGFPSAHLNRLALSTLIDLIIFFGALRSDPKVVLLRKLKGLISVSVAFPATERAAQALTNWPYGFYAELRRARAFHPRTESLSMVAKSIDHVIHLAAICLPQNELRFVTEEIGRFLQMPDEWNEQRKQYSISKKAA